MSILEFPSVDYAASALRRLTMSEIRALGALKAHSSLSRAAQALDMSQPALSHHVKEMEEKLGTQLFVRHRRGVEPTNYGAVLLRLAHAMQVDLEAAAREPVQEAYHDFAPLTIGGMAVTCGGLLAVTIARYTETASNRPVRLLEGSRPQMLEQLRHGRIDAFVGRVAPDDAHSEFHHEILLQDGVVLTAAALHPLWRQDRITMASALKYAWLLPAEDTTFHRQILDSITLAGYSLPQARVRAYPMIAAPAIVSCSELLAFMPESLAASGMWSANLKFAKLDFAWTMLPIGLLIRPEVAERKDMARFLDVLRAVAASARSAATLGQQ